VDRLDLASGDARAVECPGHRLGDHVGDLKILARVIARKVALEAARDPHTIAAHVHITFALPVWQHYNRRSDPARPC
jgi:hypothetical protein